MRVPITLPHPPNGSKLRPMIGAVVYVRVSTKEQTENLSLPTQLRACEEYCRRRIAETTGVDRATARGYLLAAGIPVRGRGRPGERAAKPAISSEVSTDSTLANPAICGAARGSPEWLTIVGVVENTPIFGLAEANAFPQLYMPIFATRNVNMAPRLDA